jgi:hypothetical protein
MRGEQREPFFRHCAGTVLSVGGDAADKYCLQGKISKICGSYFVWIAGAVGKDKEPFPARLSSKIVIYFGGPGPPIFDGSHFS